MKKLSLLFLIVLAFGAFGTMFQACDNSKTYAEMLEDERKAVNAFVKKHNIKTISKEEFEKDTITGENEYVQFSNGLYLNIVDRGNGDTIKTRDEIIVRMVEYNVMAEIDTEVGDTLSNLDIDVLTDSFFYNPTASSTLFVYDSYNGYFPYVYSSLLSQGTLDVPNGIINILPYIKDGAHVKIIVPSKLGHSYAMQYVYPYYYDIHKIQIR
ncbi:DUF4827 domain-containing protein [Bacteroides sp. 519]|uniref:DUF4827 domain-containing protein n=1 Tax=Bacteroides sp. 519 TaxID=2302937 RepID=UPI0013D4DC68|nr:DUF4827 domain-containing protein [Bacteroides sp. 519]NDV56570.1 DUF4827 domain-containing protein [Bacteroides sp. 519]